MNIDDYKVTVYSVEYRERLKSFLKKHNPAFSDVYIDFLVDNAWDENQEQPAILVLDSNDAIVGGNLFFYTKASLNGEERAIVWGHDTFLEESARRYAGLDFVLEAKRRQGMGLGISDINRKILKKQKRAKFANVYKCFYLNYNVAWHIIKKKFSIQPDCYMPKIDSIEGRDYRFERVFSEHELRIPHSGYWGCGKYDVEPIRDYDFMKKRFFENPIHQYYVYRYVNDEPYDDMYFVVRPISYKGVKTLHLVDFRYNVEKKEQVLLLSDALKKLSRKASCAMVHIVTSDMNVPQMLKGWRWIIKSAEQYVMPSFCKFRSEVPWVITTSADSDGDYHY